MSAQASQLTPHHNPGFASLKKIIGFVRYARVFLLALVLIWASNLLLKQVKDPGFLPISKVRVKGEMNQVTENMLQTAIAGQLSGGFFNTDVDAIQHSVESLAWVDHAIVRRVWPDTLFIQVVEQHAAAIWKQGGVINQRGEWFTPDKISGNAKLPTLSGPEQVRPLLFEKYNDVKQMLLKVSIGIDEINMDKRHAIYVDLDNGVRLKLGRQEQLSRLQRFIDIYPQVLAEKIQQIKQIDLRYSNGLSVEWKNPAIMGQGEN